MRIRTPAIMISLGLCLLLGCAQRRTALTASPAHAELPDLTKVERFLPVHVDVADRGHQPRMQLTPDFVEPQPTEQELAVLGQRRTLIEFLEYDVRTLSPHSRAGPYYAHIVTYNYGRGGTHAGIANVLPFIGRYPGRGGVGVGVDPFTQGISSRRYAPEISRIRPGRREGVTVGTGRASRIADHKRSIGP